MKVQNPIIGRSRGSAGGMTFCKNYDKNVARAKAFEVSNPKTASQQNQRTFFREVAGIVGTVTEDELRSLFGVKPKAMSRRNALSKQVAAAYGIVDGQKVVDFSKLESIGNGEKVTTPFMHFTPDDTDFEYEFSNSQLGVKENETVNLVYVIFKVNGNEIKLIQQKNADVQSDNIVDLDYLVEEYGEIFVYVTCGTKPNVDVNEDFGSFIIKTRAEKVGRGNTPEPATVDIQATGYAAWDTFSIDLSGTSAAGGTPTSLVNDGNVVASGFSEAGDDTFTGSFTQAVDPSAATTLLVTMPDTTQITMNVNFVD